MKLRELLQLMDGITKKIGISPAKICGGTPRDKILNKLKEIADLDITTGDKSIEYLGKELSIALGKHYSFDLKQMPDGHSSLFLGNLKIDFSSNFVVPNIDKILDGMGVKDITDMKRELFSRDFTCNALLMDLDLKTISDPTNLGFGDIRKKVIKTCLAPEITLTSNKNRVVRAIYLAAKLDFDVDPSIIKWVKKYPGSMKLSSEHTLTEKLNKAIELNTERTTFLLDQMGLWNYIPISELLYPYYSKRIGAGK
jgi:tRNA nucleotidyltransferase/poly(A) polymerase